MSHKNTLPWRYGLALSFILSLAALVLPPLKAEAAPIRSNTPWAIILCKYVDYSIEPRPSSFFRQFFTSEGAGMGGLYDYWRDISYGNIDLSGSVVVGWYRIPFTLNQEQNKSLDQKTQDCVDTASANSYIVPANFRTAVMVNVPSDAGSAVGRVMLDPNTWNVTTAAHEMGHGYNLDHSFSDDLNFRLAWWSQPGEYDDNWDIMSGTGEPSTTPAFRPAARASTPPTWIG